MNLQTSLKNIDDIRNECGKIKDEEERRLVLSSISVAKNSLEYWGNNYEKWAEVFALYKSKFSTKTTVLKSSGWFSWRKLVDADFVGLVSGATGGAAAGAVVGVFVGGVGAGPGAVVGAVSGGIGGSVGGSVGNALYQYLKSHQVVQTEIGSPININEMIDVNEMVDIEFEKLVELESHE